MKPGKVGKKKGKHKSSKSKDSSLSSQIEDVQVHTGLPPQVEGQLRCFCRVSVSQISWTIPNSPQLSHVRVKWWGEAGDGAIFRPVDTKHAGNMSPKTTARYPVRSGPKQFAAYLSDMGSLLVEVLSGVSRSPVGRAELPQVSLLSSSYPISGCFPVFSSNEEKIAEIQLSLVLEPLMASYDSMGSIPTSDISAHTVTSSQGPRSTLPKQLQPSPYAHPVRNSAEDPFASPATNKTESRKGNDSLSSVRHLDGFESAEEGRRLRPQENGDTVFITTSGDVIRAKPTGYHQASHQASHHPGNIGRQPVRLDIGAPVTSDLLGTLLDRGTKLREAMIVSSMNAETADPILQDRPPLTSAPFDLPMSSDLTSPSKRSGPGTVAYNGLSGPGQPVSPGKCQVPGESDLSDMESRAVDLIMGSSITNKEYQYLRAFEGSPHSSISDDPDLASELGDPLHDDTILQELFYKHPDSDNSSVSGLSGEEGRLRRKSTCSVASIEDPGNVRPPSRRSSVSSGAELASLEKEIRTGTPTKRKARGKVKKKTKVVKKRRRSRSATGSVSSVSDSDHLSTPRSETSRVSFDMTPSDLDEPVMDKPPKAGLDGLSVERLTLLGRVHVARVTIDSLNLTSSDLNLSSSSSRKGRGLKKGRPPKASPKPKKPCTYFIEYQFPVVATSRDKHAPNAMATEVMRVASKTVRDKSVLFNHRSVFPIYFDGCVIEKWWKSALIFKVFSRTPGQKIPAQVGCCGVSLKSILKSESLCVTRDLEIRDGSRSSRKRNSSFMDTSSMGNLRVNIELASDSKDFSSVMARTKLAEMQGKAKVVPITPRAPPTSPTRTEGPKYPMGPEALKKYKKQLAQSANLGTSTQTDPPRTDLSSLGPGVRVPALGEPRPTQTVYPDPAQARTHTDSIESPTLYTMLLIPDGKNLTVEGKGPGQSLTNQAIKLTQPTMKVSGVEGRNSTTRNTYLVCRMFWCDDVVSSNVTWGTSEPRYNFLQVAPVLVSLSLLERMRNNFMIVEVWDKKTSAQNDKLVGIVKLSLHQFYMSFRDQKIAKSLLRSQFPVISIDNYVPIVDPFSGAQFGQLKVLLAMGSSDQVSYLQRLKGEQSGVPAPERPLHFHERQDMIEKSLCDGGRTGTEAAVEHQFEVVVEGIRNLQLFEAMIWGEADCFVQYYFPAQTTQSSLTKASPQDAVCSMKSFRTATTLCLPDPTFHDVTRHRLTLSPASPVQRQILTACSGSGHGSGGLPFEVWCRYYHPNVRDQVAAKGTLPLAKLCAMVTMQKKGESAVQTFSLPLTPALSHPNDLDPEKQAKVQDSGLMDVTVTYKSQLSQGAAGVPGSGKQETQVCISVGVIRASGLKSAAEALAHLDTGMQYPAEVGVNAYTKVHFSFLTKQDERITRTVARSFAPEFSHHMDFPCPLLWTEADSDALSLAEILESGEVTLEVWHQVPGLSSGWQEPEIELDDDGIKGRQLVCKTGDVLLGTTTVQLRALLTHRTGISGWYPINISSNQWAAHKDNKHQSEEASHSGGKGLGRVVGGVELSVKFAHHEDRERVIHAARGVGWSPLDVDVEEEDWESEEESGGRAYQMQVAVDQASFPLLNAMIIGQTKLDRSARCYIRYKVYDRAAVVSKAHSVSHREFGVLRSTIKHKQLLQLPDSSPLKWYLREERLEIQVWVSYGQHTAEQRPRHRDKLIGSAFISMETLADPRRKQHQISGLYPLFKPGSASLGGAYLRASISLKPLLGSIEQISHIEEGSDVLEDEDYDPNDSFHQLAAKTTRHEVKGQEEEPVTPSFTVHISIERAMHLPWVSEKHGSPSCAPNTYVSFQTSDVSRPVVTGVVVSCDGPVWDYQTETQLTTELLYQENKNLVFKVWHKPDTASKGPDKSSDRVLGFVSVDLVPLTTGLQQICGWYNIIDFNGQCQGQIKVSVTPLESLCQYRGGLPSLATADECPAPPRSSVFYPPVLPHLPWSDPLAGAHHPSDTSLPHFQEHYQSVKHHHERLQRQGQLAPPGDSQGEQPPPSLHWKPQIPIQSDEATSSKSFLFSALRKQLNDLDEINDKFKARLAMTEPAHEMPERIPLSSRSDQLPGTSQLDHLNLNCTIGASSYTSQSVGKDSARDSVTGPDSGNVTGTHHEISSDLIGSHSAAPSARSIRSGEGTQSLTFGAPGEHPVISSLATNTLTSELEVSEEFLRNHVPPQIQELLEAARQLHQPASAARPPETVAEEARQLHQPASAAQPPETVAEEARQLHQPASAARPPERVPEEARQLHQPASAAQPPETVAEEARQLHQPASAARPPERVPEEARQLHQPVSAARPPVRVPEEALDLSSEEEEGDQQNYFHRYQDFLQHGEQEDSDSDHQQDDTVDIIMPRALNDISGKGFLTGEVTEVSQPDDAVVVPQPAHVMFPSTVLEVSEVTDTDSYLAEPHFTTVTALSPPVRSNSTPPASSQAGQSEGAGQQLVFDIDSLSDGDEGGEESGESETSDRQGVVAQDRVLQTAHPQDSGDDSSGGVENSNNNAKGAQSSPRSNQSDAHNSPRSNNSGESQSSEVKVIKELPPLAGSAWGQSKAGNTDTNSDISTPRAPANTARQESSDEETTDNHSLTDKPSTSDHSTPREGTLPQANLPNFFPTAVQLEQSMKALQLVTGKISEIEDNRGREQTSDEPSKGRITVKNAKFQTSSIRNKPLPTADETKRIAKIFASKFASIS